MSAVKNVILIGMPGSGKSTVGVLLAKTLGLDFVDTDLLLQRREGALLQDLLDRRGLEAFLDAEEEAVRALDCAGCVVATGGSAVCRPAAAEHLRALGAVVYLRTPPEELARRIGDITTRGVAMGPGETLAGLYARRRPLYETCAHLTVDTGGLTLEQSVAAVLRALTGLEGGPA